jgi:glutamate synthase domain-containing protein 3
VRRMLENHVAYTGSVKAKQVLRNWERYAGRFVKVMPKAYAEVLRKSMGEGRDARIAPPPRAREGVAAIL